MSEETGQLSKAEIIRRLQSSDADTQLVIAPLIDPFLQIQSSAVDLRLGNEFLVTQESRHTHVDPASLSVEDAELTLQRRTDRVRKHRAIEPFVLHPGQFALGSTLEFVGLPGDISARVEGRSTWARIGIQVHSTATNIHPWSAGVITFELQNGGRLPVELYPGMRIAQLTLTHLSSPVPKPANDERKYQLDLRAAPSRFWRDPEMDWIKALKQDQKRRDEEQDQLFSRLRGSAGAA